MKSRPLHLFASCLFACALGVAPAIAQTMTARSHVERFSTPEVRAERSEAEATSKLARAPNDAAAFFERALARMRLNRYPEAHDDLRRAIALKPNDAEYRASLGYTLWKMGRAREAIETERAALRLDDKNYTAHYQLGRFLIRTSDPDGLRESVAHLKRALEIDPRQYEVRFELIAAARLVGDVALAMGQVDLLQDALPSDPRVTYVAALLAADRGDINAAIGGFRDALRRDPALYGARQDLGLAFIKLERWSEAVETFAQLANEQAASVDAAYFHALALFNTGRTREAEAEARRALRLSSGAAQANTLLGITLLSRGAIAEANDALAQAVAVEPTNFDAQFYLGRTQYLLKEHSAAANSLRAAIKLNPRHAEARFLFGTVLEAAGDTQAALNEYQRLAQDDPRSAFGQLGSGALLIKQGKTEEAIVALKRAVSSDAKNFEAQLALGRALALAEQHAEAIEALQRAVALAPERADAHYQLGLSLRRAGRAQEAAREFATVERLNREFRTASAP